VIVVIARERSKSVVAGYAERCSALVSELLIRVASHEKS